MKQKRTRHWLDKATPLYWNPRGVWRVRATRQGIGYQWLMKTGRGDSGSTGKACAVAEWTATKLRIIREERSQENESNDFFSFGSPDEEQEFYRQESLRSDYLKSAMAKEITFDEWKDYQD